MVEVEIKAPFETSTHKVPKSAVGKKMSVEPHVAKRWAEEGWAEVDSKSIEGAGESSHDKKPRKPRGGKKPKTPEDNKPKPKTPESGSLEKLSKVELLAIAAKNGLDASESMSSDELRSLIESA